MNPGAPLTALLASVDPDEVSDHDAVVMVRAHQRMESHHQAQRFAWMVTVAERMDAMFPDDPELAWDATALEVGTWIRARRG